MSGKPLLAADRAALFLQLVPYLISKGEVSVAEAADEFEVTPDQMRAMVETLTVIGRPGEGGFWQMANDLFDIDWDLLDERDLIVITNTVGLERTPRLTAREAAALLAGLHVAAALPGVGDSETVQGLLSKLARGASSTPVDVIIAPDAVDEARAAVAEAISRGVAVTFDYKAPDAPVTTRTVDPVKVHIAGGQWYLQGWCHLREAMRTFHVDRIAKVAVTDIASTHATSVVPDLFASVDDDTDVDVRFTPEIRPLLADYGIDDEVSEGPESVRASIRVGDPRSLKRVACRLGGDIEVLAPGDAREAARAWAAAGLAQYV